MLRFDLTELLRTPGMRQVYEIHEAPYTDEDVEYVAPVVGRIVVTNTGTMVLVRGPIDTVIAMECSRCLDPVRAPIHADLEEEFDLNVVEEGVRHDKDVQVVEEEVGPRVRGEDALHLDVLIRQAALLNAPLQPLCRETCPGIPVQEAAGPGRGSGEKLALPCTGPTVKRIDFRSLLLRFSFRGDCSMPLPKRRHSNQRTRKRRTHYKLTPPTLARTSVCPIASQRGGCPVFQYRLDHHACPGMRLLRRQTGGRDQRKSDRRRVNDAHENRG